MNTTPQANRLHIAIYGRRNAGKSSLLNAITGQELAIVSEHAGTTADPVSKAMEIPGIGPCVFIDTAGFDDSGDLGELRVKKTEQTLSRADLALIVCSSEELSLEQEWANKLKTAKIPFLIVVNKADELDAVSLAAKVKEQLKKDPIIVSSKTKEGIPQLLGEILRTMPEDFGTQSITGNLADDGDVVVLVMPQDSEAPKGRLILPQVQTIREMLEKNCISINTTPQRLTQTLAVLKQPPKLIITDSQAFKEVYPLVPKQTMLTSFSVLFAAYKGDISIFRKGADQLDSLTEDSRVLIAEACTHAPLTEDIGRVKIPAMLRKRIGPGITIEHVSGTDFPQDLRGYNLVVHCGGCMFNRRFMLSRAAQAQAQGVAMTNYGILIAKLTGILDKIVLPES